jgi:hypothetical protein
VNGGRLLDARDLQHPPWSLTKRQAYRVLEAVGVRLSERRICALPERVEEFFRGGDAMPRNGTGVESGPRPVTGTRA